MDQFPLLFAARFDGWIPVIVAIVWVIISVLKNAGDTPENKPAQRQPQPAPRPRPPGQPQPQNELEQFLQELGVKREEPAKPEPQRRASQSTQQRQQRQAQRQRKVDTTPQEPSVSTPRATVQDRHLQSRLETRHQEVLHSDLESKKLVSEPNRNLVSSDLRQTSQAPTEAPRRGQAARGLAFLVKDRKMLGQAFVLGEVLGKPLALRDDPVDPNR